MKKKIITLITLAFVAGTISAQELISTAGGHYSADTQSIDWSLGEVVIATFSEGDYVLTQGFHQSNVTVTPIDEIPGTDLHVTVYPNPTSDYVTVRLADPPSEGTGYGLYDFSGQRLFGGGLSDHETTLSFQTLDAGIYFLRIYTGRQAAGKFKIVKQ